MSRYLTPSKIGLLALISGYTDSVVPTASTIPILSFIVSLILPLNAAGATKELNRLDQKVIISIDDFQKATITHASGVPGRTVWDLLLIRLWEINSFDALHVFFDNLSSLLVKTREEQQRDIENGVSLPIDRMLLSRTSPLGTFVRRAQLEFTRLQFHDTTVLWKSFITYREPTLPTWKRRNAAAGKTTFDVNLQGNSLSWEDRLTDILYGDLQQSGTQEGSISTDDVERLLEFQVDEMQKMGNRISEEMKDQFRSMVQTGVTVPSLSHYVKFLDSWKAGDYPSSFDNLHRYFDYTMHNRDRTFYQYALLNLAILQADFGCYSEAISAMQETISTARENKDMGCLNFSLSWLYHLGKAHPGEMAEVGKSGMLGTEKEGLAFLKAKAKETGMWSLLSTTLLSEAKLLLTNGDSIAVAFENLVKATHLNITKNVTAMVGAQMAMQASIFGRLGVTQLAWSYGETFLQCYASQSPKEDVLKCICRGSELLARRGRYNEAMSMLEDIDPETLRTLKFHQYWTISFGNLVAAGHFLAQLRAAPAPDSEVAYSISLLHLELLIRQEDYSTALDTLEDYHAELAEENSDILQRVKLLTLKARILDKCGRPEKGFSIAIRAATIAHRARLLPALWDAVGAVSNVLINLKEFAAAGKMLESIMPQVLECEDCNLAARTYSLLVDAQMGQAGQAKLKTPKRKEHLIKALEFIDRAFGEFSRIEDVQGQCEMMAKKATIMHLVGDLVLANDYAAKYLDIKREAADDN
ncbi:Anaphase-promoting complex subunit 5 [Acarospora aff. strigata]|nr:Anaphase-promoting complex subunit 5 [Acarospora aff. strigata]